VISNFKTLNLVKIIALFFITGLHLLFFISLSYQIRVAQAVDPKIISGIILAIILILPFLIARFFYKSKRSQLEFGVISYITTIVVTIAFLQINNRSDITTAIPFVDQIGLSFSWGSNLGLLMLTCVVAGVFYDLFFGRYLDSFRLSFTSTFALQLILSLGFLSYIHLISVGDFSQRYYKIAWLDLLINTPIWLWTSLFAFISALVTIFYFGRGTTLPNKRSFWVKIAWRLLIVLVHLELVAMIMILPQNYWWKVLFYILIWDFIAIPLARVYKQNTDLFWDRLKVSLIYHVVLFTIVFAISHR
jgi:hypothetical protein